MKSSDVEKIIALLMDRGKDVEIQHIDFCEDRGKEYLDCEIVRHGHRVSASYKIDEETGDPRLVTQVVENTLRELVEDMMPAKEDDLDPHLDNLYNYPRNY